MWIDPRIQGKLRKLLEACREALLTHPELVFNLAAEAFHYTDRENNTLGRAYASWYYANALQKKEEYGEAEQLLIEVKEYAQRAGENTLLAGTYRLLGHCSQSRDEKLAEKMYLEGLQLFREDDVNLERCMILNSLSQCYLNQGRIAETITTIYRLKQDIESSSQYLLLNKDASYIRIRMLYTLGVLLGILRDPSTSLTYFDEAIEIAREGGFTKEIIELNRVMGIGYNNLRRYDEAEKCLRKLLDEYSSNIIPVEKGGILRVLGSCLINTNRIDEAEQILNEAMCLTKGEERLLLIQREMATIKLLRNDPEGLKMLNEVRQHYKVAERSSNVSETDDFKRIADFYKRTRDYEKASEYQDLYIIAIQEDRDRRQIAFARIHEQKATETLEHEKLVFEKDKEILRLELEKNQTKLQHQERELALTASQLASQTDLLSHFRDDLRKIVREMADPIDALRNIKQKLKELPCEQIDWAKFERDFVAVHPEFMHKLTERFPTLTPMEAKMCTLIRLNLKSHEIARLLCMAERTVEFHRLNVRKKLEIPKAQSLSVFLNTL